MVLGLTMELELKVLAHFNGLKFWMYVSDIVMRRLVKLYRRQLGV